MVKRLNVSVPDAFDEYLTQHNLSASTLLQQIITQHKERWEEFNRDRSDEIKLWREKCASLRAELEKRINFIENKGLIEEFEKYV